MVNSVDRPSYRGSDATVKCNRDGRPAVRIWLAERRDQGGLLVIFEEDNSHGRGETE